MEDTSDRQNLSPDTLEPTDHEDRLLTANAQHYHTITGILVDALPVIARRAGPINQKEIREANRILGKNPNTRNICNHILEMRGDCVAVTASLLDIQIDAAQHLLDWYCGCVDSGRLPTNSFGRWLRKTARLAEAARE